MLLQVSLNQFYITSLNRIWTSFSIQFPITPIIIHSFFQKSTFRQHPPSCFEIFLKTRFLHKIENDVTKYLPEEKECTFGINNSRPYTLPPLLWVKVSSFFKLFFFSFFPSFYTFVFELFFCSNVGGIHKHNSVI